MEVERDLRGLGYFRLVIPFHWNGEDGIPFRFLELPYPWNQIFLQGPEISEDFMKLRAHCRISAISSTIS